MSLPSAADVFVPVTLRPRILPSTVVPLDRFEPLSSTRIAYLPEPTMTLHSPVHAPPGVVDAVPPMSVLVAPMTWTP